MRLVGKGKWFLFGREILQLCVLWTLSTLYLTCHTSAFSTHSLPFPSSPFSPSSSQLCRNFFWAGLLPHWLQRTSIDSQSQSFPIWRLSFGSSDGATQCPCLSRLEPEDCWLGGRGCWRKGMGTHVCRGWVWKLGAGGGRVQEPGGKDSFRETNAHGDKGPEHLKHHQGPGAQR